MLLTSLAEMMQTGLGGAALSRRRALALRVGAVLAFLALWSLAAGAVVFLHLFNPVFLAGPWLVLGKVGQLAIDGQLGGHVGATLQRVAIGFGGGAGLGVLLGLAAGYLPRLRQVFEPVVELLRPIPPLAMLPLFIVWVGIGEGSKIGFITYATFFPVYMTTVHAVQQVDPLLLRAAASLGARRQQLFFRVLLPATLPEILTGIRLGVALAFFVIVISEFIGAEQGLGFLINDGRNFFLVPQMLGAAAVLGALGYASNALVAWLGRRRLRGRQPASP